MLKPNTIGILPPKNKYPAITIHKNFLSEEDHKSLIEYLNNSSEKAWGITKDIADRPTSPVRFKLVEHSKNPSLKYLRTFILDDEHFEKLKVGEIGEPFPEGLENPVDWHLVLHDPQEKKILDIIATIDRQVAEHIYNLYGQEARCTFPPVFTMIADNRSMRLHCDGYDFDSERRYNESICYFSSIYYINDDYDGGEHFTPYLGLTYKPRANSLILNCTPWDEDMAHGVKPVTSGKRFVRQHFWTLKNQ